MLHQGAGRARGGLPSLLLGRSFDLWASFPWSFSSTSDDPSSRQSEGELCRLHPSLSVFWKSALFHSLRRCFWERSEL